MRPALYFRSGQRLCVPSIESRTFGGVGEAALTSLTALSQQRQLKWKVRARPGISACGSLQLDFRYPQQSAVDRSSPPIYIASVAYLITAGPANMKPG